jgi:hypothetical protein
VGSLQRLERFPQIRCHLLVFLCSHVYNGLRNLREKTKREKVRIIISHTCYGRYRSTVAALIITKRDGFFDHHVTTVFLIFTVNVAGSVSLF